MGGQCVEPAAAQRRLRPPPPAAAAGPQRRPAMKRRRPAAVGRDAATPITTTGATSFRTVTPEAVWAGGAWRGRGVGKCWRWERGGGWAWSWWRVCVGGIPGGFPRPGSAAPPGPPQLVPAHQRARPLPPPLPWSKRETGSESPAGLMRTGGRDHVRLRAARRGVTHGSARLPSARRRPELHRRRCHWCTALFPPLDSFRRNVWGWCACGLPTGDGDVMGRRFRARARGYKGESPLLVELTLGSVGNHR